MSDTTTKWKATVTTECTCEVYDEESGEYVADSYSDTCYGCWDDNLYDFTDNFLPEWTKFHGVTEDDDIIVWSDAMLWDRRSGYAVCKVGTLTDTLGLNGEYRLEFEFDPESGNLTCTRYSHDEPTGALFKVGYLRDIEESE